MKMIFALLVILAALIAASGQIFAQEDGTPAGTVREIYAPADHPANEPAAAAETTIQEGVPGQPGQNGRDGHNGRDGINGRDGGRGPQGQKGSQGRPGPRGPRGPMGPQGLRGPQGLPGRDAVTTRTKDPSSSFAANAVPAPHYPSLLRWPIIVLILALFGCCTWWYRRYAGTIYITASGWFGKHKLTPRLVQVNILRGFSRVNLEKHGKNLTAGGDYVSRVKAEDSDIIRYRIRYQNRGLTPKPANRVMIKDIMEGTVTYVPGTIKIFINSCDHPIDCPTEAADEIIRQLHDGKVLRMSDIPGAPSTLPKGSLYLTYETEVGSAEDTGDIGEGFVVIPKTPTAEETDQAESEPEEPIVLDAEQNQPRREEFEELKQKVESLSASPSKQNIVLDISPGLLETLINLSNQEAPESVIASEKTEGPKPTDETAGAEARGELEGKVVETSPEEREKQRRLKMINKIAKEVVYSPSDRDVTRMLGFSNFTEDGIRYYIKRLKAKHEIYDACDKIGITPGGRGPWDLSILVVNEKATPKQIAAALKANKTPEQIKEVFSRSENGILEAETVSNEAYQEAQKEVLGITQEIGYTKEVADSEAISRWSRNIAPCEGQQRQEMKDKAKIFFQNAFDVQSIKTEEEGEENES